MNNFDEVNKKYLETIDKQDSMIAFLEGGFYLIKYRLKDYRKKLFIKLITFRLKREDIIHYKEIIDDYKLVKTNLKYMKDFRNLRA